jgi:hypothetical protein
MNNEYVIASDGELYHYGVLGMKWGVRRGHSDKAYARASKKLRKLDKKADKALEKAYSAKSKVDRKMDSFFASEKSISKAQTKADKAMRKATVQANKARKWVKAMEKTFTNTPESLSKEQIELGKKYTDIMNRRSF